MEAVGIRVVVANWPEAFRGIVADQVDHFAMAASCVAAAVMVADSLPSASAALEEAEFQKTEAAEAFVRAVEGPAEVVVPSVALAAAYDPMDQ